MSVYERELLAIVYAVQKWGSYLSHVPFMIKTDQKSIKHLWYQKLNTPFKQVWVSKLLGFYFEIQYKEGASNVVAYALSRKDGSELLALVLSNASWSLALILLLEKPLCSDYIIQLLGAIRAETWLRVRWNCFLLEGHDQRYCHFYQELWHLSTQKKTNLTLLLILDSYSPFLPNQIWTHITMDFIEGLPNSSGKQVIFVVVDRLYLICILLLTWYKYLWIIFSNCMDFLSQPLATRILFF